MEATIKRQPPFCFKLIIQNTLGEYLLKQWLLIFNSKIHYRK